MKEKIEEKILLLEIEKCYKKGNNIKCVKLVNKYFLKHYNLEKLLNLNLYSWDSFFLNNAKHLADAIQYSYTEEEMAVFSTSFIQKLLDNNWGGINKGVLFGYVPALINYDNLKDIPYNMLYDLYDKENNSDILRRFNENIDLEHALKLYKNKKENINFDIKCILLMKFYESDDYITYYNELSNDDKELFVNNLILKNNDSKSLEIAYRLFLLNNKRSLYDHIKTYDTGMYTYYLLKECKNLSEDDINELTNKLKKCEDTQYKLFYAAYSYRNNPYKLAEQLFSAFDSVNIVGGLILFFDTLERKCTNSFEFARIKALYEIPLKHERLVLGQKIESVEINENYSSKFNAYNDASVILQNPCKKMKPSEDN